MSSGTNTCAKWNNQLLTHMSEARVRVKFEDRELQYDEEFKNYSSMPHKTARGSNVTSIKLLHDKHL